MERVRARSRGPVGRLEIRDEVVEGGGNRHVLTVQRRRAMGDRMGYAPWAMPIFSCASPSGDHCSCPWVPRPHRDRRDRRAHDV
jgi:hypothetical protein